MTRRFALAVVVVAVVLAVAGRARATLTANQLLLIVNKNEPAGGQLARFYAEQRHVPDGRILELDLPKGDEITPKQYAEGVVPQVRAFLHDHGLEDKVKAAVTFYGVPLRINARQTTPAEQAELNLIGREREALPAQMRPAIEQVEVLARRLDPAFTAGNGQLLPELLQRWAAASTVVVQQLPTIPNPDRQMAVNREFWAASGPMTGAVGQLLVRQIDVKLHPDSPDAAAVAAATTAAKADRPEAAKLEATPEDADARDKLRKLVREQFGLAQYERLLADQAHYLDARHGSAAFDSELAVVRWPVHPYNFIGGDPLVPVPPGTAARPTWFFNPLFYGSAAYAPAGQPTTTPPVLMVTRLDAPTVDLVRAMIATGIRVEERGLRGKIVIDSLGAVPGHEDPKRKGYGPYDQTLREFHDIAGHAEQGGKPVEVVFDANDAVLPAGSASDVAVYVGWYAVDGYVASCQFAGGAVAMHVASYTLTTLHPTGRPNWAAGLLTDGAVATIGPVAEPYLPAFPRADDFFPLLMTGQLTLAECYWHTEPFASWQMTIIGDPLYTPYKAAPALTVADMPLHLRKLFADVPPPPPAKP